MAIFFLQFLVALRVFFPFVITHYFFLWQYSSTDFLHVFLVWKRAGTAGGVGVHSCMLVSRGTAMLACTLGKGSTVSLLPILGGWARRARWWCRVQHSQAWTQRMLTFAFADCCRERKNLLFHMLVLVATLPSTHCAQLPSSAPPLQSQPDGSPNIVYLGWQSQMQSVSTGIPIPPSLFAHSSAEVPPTLTLTLKLHLRLLNVFLCLQTQQIDSLIYTLFLSPNYSYFFLLFFFALSWSHIFTPQSH